MIDLDAKREELMNSPHPGGDIGKHGVETYRETRERQELEREMWKYAERIFHSSRCELRIFDNEDIARINASLKPVYDDLNDKTKPRKRGISGC
jgi:hypothetical protein